MNIHKISFAFFLLLPSVLSAMQEGGRSIPLVNVVEARTLPTESAPQAAEAAEYVTQKYSSLLFPLPSSHHISRVASAQLANRICAMKSSVNGEIVTVESTGLQYLLKMWRKGVESEQVRLKLVASVACCLDRPEIALSGDGTRLALRQHGLIKIFDTKNIVAGNFGKASSIQAQGNDFSSIAFSADGTKMAVGNIDTIQVFDVQTGVLVGTCGSRASLLAFNAEGTRLASADDGEVKIWDIVRPVNGSFAFLGASQVETHEFFYETGTIEGPWGSTRSQMDYTTCVTPLTQVTFSHRGSKLIASNNGGRLQMWSDVAHNANLKDANRAFGSNAIKHNNFGHPFFTPISLPDSNVSALAFSPDGRRVVTGGSNGLVLLTARDGLLMKTLANVSKDKSVTHLAFCSDNELVTVAADNELTMWKLSNLIQGKWTLEQALLLRKLCEGKLTELPAKDAAEAFMTLDAQTRDSLLATFKVKLNERNELVQVGLLERAKALWRGKGSSRIQEN